MEGYIFVGEKTMHYRHTIFKLLYAYFPLYKNSNDIQLDECFFSWQSKLCFK